MLSRGAKIVPASGSAITNAVGVGKIEIIQLLLSYATDADLDSSRDALNWAAAAGYVNTVKLLIEHGFNVNTTAKHCIVGETPLLAACEFKKMNSQRMSVAKLLIEEGANVNARNQNGKTATELLVQNDSEGLLREDVQLQQLLAGTDTRCDKSVV